jgi:hypothetical protein
MHTFLCKIDSFATFVWDMLSSVDGFQELLLCGIFCVCLSGVVGARGLPPQAGKSRLKIDHSFLLSPLTMYDNSGALASSVRTTCAGIGAGVYYFHR